MRCEKRSLPGQGIEKAMIDGRRRPYLRPFSLPVL